MSFDREWFSEQVRASEPAMYRLALSYLKQEDTALDCMQQSILKAYEHRGSLRDPEKFRAWIIGILVNCCKDEWKRQKKVLLPGEDMSEPSAPEPSVTAETSLTLWSAVDRLEEPYRTVLVLYYYEDLPTKEIAMITGKRPTAVRKQLERGRRLLREMLEQEGFDDDR